MKKYLHKIIFIYLFFIGNLYADHYYIDFYGYVKEYSDPTAPSFNNQIKTEKNSNFTKIIKYLESDNLTISTFAGNSIGDITEHIPQGVNSFQCSMILDNFIRFFNKKIYDYSLNSKIYFFDIDAKTNFIFTTCPILKYNFLNQVINPLERNIFLINSHPYSLKIVEKLILENKIDNFKIYIKNYHFLSYEDLNSQYTVFSKNNSKLFFDENDILKDFNLDKKILNLDDFDINYFYNAYKNHYIKKYSNNNNLIKESDIIKSFNFFKNSLK